MIVARAIGGTGSERAARSTWQLDHLVISAIQANQEIPAGATTTREVTVARLRIDEQDEWSGAIDGLICARAERNDGDPSAGVEIDISSLGGGNQGVK